MDELFRGVHMSLKPFRSKTEVSTAEVFQRAEKALLEGGEARVGKGETLSSMMEQYRKQMEEVQEPPPRKNKRGRASLLEPNGVGRMERQDSLLSNFSDMSFTFAPRYNLARMTQIMKRISQKYGFIDWVMLKPNSTKLELFNRDSFGEGTIYSLVDCFEEITRTECYGYFRVVTGGKHHFYLVHFMTSQKQAKSKLTKVMLDRLRHTKRIDIWNFRNFNVNYIIEKITKNVDKFKDSIKAYQTELEARNRDVEKVLPADMKKSQSSDEQRHVLMVRKYVKRVRDESDPMNWILIDPADSLRSGKSLKTWKH